MAYSALAAFISLHPYYRSVEGRKRYGLSGCAESTLVLRDSGKASAAAPFRRGCRARMAGLKGFKRKRDVVDGYADVSGDDSSGRKSCFYWYE